MLTDPSVDVVLKISCNTTLQNVCQFILTNVLSRKFEVAFPNSTPMCWIINENTREPLHTF